MIEGKREIHLRARGEIWPISYRNVAAAKGARTMAARMRGKILPNPVNTISIEEIEIVLTETRVLEVLG